MFSDLSPENTIQDEEGNVIGVSGSPIYIAGDVTNPIPVSLPLDPFGRHVVANPTLLFAFSHYGIGTSAELWDTSASGSGAISHNTTTSSVTLTNTTASGDQCIVKSRKNIEYIRGKSQLQMLSCNPGQEKANLRKRWGFFNSNNGIYFELNGTTFNVVKRSSVTGSVVNTSVSQSSFNGDKLNGTGTSGLTLDFTKQNLYFFEWSWLGTNIIRFGVVINGKNIVMHQMNFANEVAYLWAQYPIFPVRYEQTNTGTVASTSYFNMNCGAVISNGGDELGQNQILNLDTGYSSSGISLNTTPILLAALRLRSGFEHLSIRPIEFSFQPISGTAVGYYRMLLNPTIVGGNWANQGSISEGLTGYTSYTGGSVILSGYVDLGSSGSGGGNSSKGGPLTTSAILTDIYIGSNIVGASDVLAMEIRTLSSSGAVHFTGSFKEFV